MSGKPISGAMRPDLGTLWRHRARVVAALYGFVALVGTLYYALLLGDFGLNPFHYWDASDFLLATFREPLSIVFGLIAVAFYFTMFRGREFNDVLFGRVSWVRRLTLYDRWRDSPWMAPRFGVGVSVLAAVAWFLVVMGGVAADAARDARRGEGRTVRYALGDGALREAQLLATANRFVFLVVPGEAPRDPALHAVPIESLLEIRYCGARRGWVAAFVRAEQCEPAAKAVPTSGKTSPPAPEATVAPPGSNPRSQSRRPAASES